MAVHSPLLGTLSGGHRGRQTQWRPWPPRSDRSRIEGKGRARAGIVAQEEAHTEIINAFARGEIDRDTAVARAHKVHRVFDIVPVLQTNFAFTRAYEAESSGKDGGFPGPNVYLDATIFREGIPDWIGCEPPKPWRLKKTSLSTSFVTLSDIADIDDSVARASLRTGGELRALLSHPGGRRFLD